jgi:hypothetical protein
VRLPMPYDVFVHDYAWICPAHNADRRQRPLLRRAGRRGLPDLRAAQRLQPGRIHLGSGAAHSQCALAARGAPRHSALERHRPTPATPLPGSAGRSAAPRHSDGTGGGSIAPRVAEGNRRVRVALIGAIGEHKGYQDSAQRALAMRVRTAPAPRVCRSSATPRMIAPLLARPARCSSPGAIAECRGPASCSDASNPTSPGCLRFGPKPGAIRWIMH